MLTYWIYKDGRGEWRWQLVHQNGNIIADSGEGYVNKANCINGIHLCAGSTGAPIRDK